MSSRSDGFFPQAETRTPYEKGYQQGRAEMLNEIIGMCKHGFIDKISLEFMSEQNEQKNE